MNACEPGQVRKEAAVSESFHVPKGSLIRANDKRSAWIATSIVGARYNHYTIIYNDLTFRWTGFGTVEVFF